MYIYALEVLIVVLVCISKAKTHPRYYYVSYATVLYFFISYFAKDPNNANATLYVFIGYIVMLAPLVVSEDEQLRNCKRRQKTTKPSLK